MITLSCEKGEKLFMCRFLTGKIKSFLNNAAQFKKKGGIPFTEWKIFSSVLINISCICIYVTSMTLILDYLGYQPKSENDTLYIKIILADI